MRFIAERNDRHQENVAFRLLRCGFADAPDQEVVDVQREMWTVVLDRSDRQDDYGLALCDLAQFRPSVVLIEIVFAHHAGLSGAATFEIDHDPQCRPKQVHRDAT